MKNSRYAQLGIALLLLILVKLTVSTEPPRQIPSMNINETVTGKVTRVVDGDSIYVEGKKYRLWGVDAPEETDFGYEQAKSTLRNITLHKTVTCTCRDIDRHGRSIVICQLENGSDVGEIMVRSGWALDYRKHTHGYYEKAEDAAKEAKLGLWAPR